MSDTQPPQPTGTGATATGATATGATAALAGIRQRREKVIKAVLVPGWYWWAMAAGMVAIGAARDTGDLLAQAITIPLAAFAMVVLTGAMIPAVRRRVQVHGTAQPRAAAAIFGLIVLVDGVTLGTAGSLAAARSAHPGTIGTAAGAAVIVIAGPLVNRYLSRLMLNRARPEMSDAPDAGDTP